MLQCKCKTHAVVLEVLENAVHIGVTTLARPRHRRIDLPRGGGAPLWAPGGGGG
jgi:hypothetical protein